MFYVTAGLFHHAQCSNFKLDHSHIYVIMCEVHEDKQQRRVKIKLRVVSYHCKGHAVNFMFVFGLVLPEWTVPLRTEETEFM